MKVLTRLYATHKDRRGLGDTVQFIIVIKHIKKHYPDWELFTETTSGKVSCFNGFVSQARNIQESLPHQEYNKIINFNFPEPNSSTSDLSAKYNVPATKVTHTIVEDLKVTPDINLYKYEIKIQEQIRRTVKHYMQGIPNKNGIVTIHYRASSSPFNKDIDEREVNRLCDSLIHNGYTPLILDWKGSGIPDQKRIFHPDKNNSIWNGNQTGDAATIAAIIEQSRLFIGVDSGPLHLAGATQTPSIGYWKFNHPVHFFDISNVIHMIPHDHLKYMKSNNKPITDDFFQRNYRHRWYASHRRGDSIIETVHEALDISKEKRKNNK